jgi:hypothetical protein
MNSEKKITENLTDKKNNIFSPLNEDMKETILKEKKII